VGGRDPGLVEHAFDIASQILDGERFERARRQSGTSQIDREHSVVPGQRSLLHAPELRVAAETMDKHHGRRIDAVALFDPMHACSGRI